MWRRRPDGISAVAGFLNHGAQVGGALPSGMTPKTSPSGSRRCRPGHGRGLQAGGAADARGQAALHGISHRRAPTTTGREPSHHPLNDLVGSFMWESPGLGASWAAAEFDAGPSRGPKHVRCPTRVISFGVEIFCRRIPRHLPSCPYSRRGGPSGTTACLLTLLSGRRSPWRPLRNALLTAAQTDSLRSAVRRRRRGWSATDWAGQPC